LLHELAKTHASFDDPHLVSRAGLVPVMALAQRAGLGDLVEEHVRPGGPCGVNAHLKTVCLVAGMTGGADSIEDMDLLRHGAMPALFGGLRAPSTLGSFLRSFTWGNVLQLGKVNRLLLAELARRTPLLPGKDTVAFADIDSMQKRIYGRQKQGGAFGHTKIQAAPRGVLSYPRCSREKLGGRFLGLMAYLDPKGEGDNSMPGKQRSCSGIWNDALRGPRDMAKAELPVSQSPEGETWHPPERCLEPAPRPVLVCPGGRYNLWEVERCPMRAFKEMSGEPKSR
jgi:hypothetical protein